MTVPVESILRTALAQAGKSYVFGAEASAADPSPLAFDCSELVEWACARSGVTPTMPDGTWAQQAFCRDQVGLMSVEAGIDTRGALLFNHRDAGGNPVQDMSARPATAHVAFSLGDGTTMEAMGTQWGTRIGSAGHRNWTTAARIPGADYAPGTVTTPPRPPAAPVPGVAGGPPWMKLGSIGDNVKRLQQNLIAFGVDRIPHHPTTGQFSDLTDIGIRLVQEYVRSHFDPKMEVDGQCGPITWGWVSYLASAPADTAPPVGGPPRRPDLSVVKRGVPLPQATIEPLQKMLLNIGIRRLGGLTANGHFGSLTDLAVRLFQWHVKSTYDGTMDVDGICGPVTWAYLERLLSKA
jgi:cell wall-associated NlpC family hydrolase